MQHRSSSPPVDDGPHYLRLSPRLRNYLALAGMASFAAAAAEPLGHEQYRVSVLGAMLLVTAALSSIPVPVGKRRNFGTLWTLPLDETPPPSPRAGISSGAVVGTLFALVWGTSAIWGAIFGATAGLLYGAAAPLARYRLGHGLLVALASGGYTLAAYPDASDAAIGVAFGSMLGAIAALQWETDFLKWKRTPNVSEGTDDESAV